MSIRVVRAYPLVEIGQTAPCRVIRGNSISVYSALPPLIVRMYRTILSRTQFPNMCGAQAMCNYRYIYIYVYTYTHTHTHTYTHTHTHAHTHTSFSNFADLPDMIRAAVPEVMVLYMSANT